MANLQVGDIVRYTAPGDGETALRFEVRELRGDRVLLASLDFPASRLTPHEVVAVSDVEPVSPSAEEFFAHLRAVRDALAARLQLKRTPLSIEYPGYLQLDCGEGAVWSFGTANVTWGGTFERDGVSVGGFETPYTMRSGSVEQIAEALASGFLSAEYES